MLFKQTREREKKRQEISRIPYGFMSYEQKNCNQMNTWAFVEREEKQNY